MRRAPNRRDRRPQANGCPKNKRARRSTSDQEEDSNSEDEEQDEGAVNDKNPKLNGIAEAEKSTTNQENETSDQDNLMDVDKGTELTNGVKVEKEDEETEGKCHVNGDVKKEEEESEQSVTKPYTEPPKPYAEMQSESPAQTEQDAVTTTTAEPSGDVEQKPIVQSESTQPAADVPPPPLVKRKQKQLALQPPVVYIE